MSDSQSYRAGTIKKRSRRTKAQIEQLDAQILDVLDEDHPQSVRHVFYMMTDPRLPEPVEKSDKGYRAVQSRCAKLRRSGDLPYRWITDATRRGFHVPTYRDRGEFIRQMAGHYRGDLWFDAGEYCEVWCESRSIAGAIEDTCEELAVSLYPCGGFSSITLAHEAARQITWECHDGRPATIFYVGDYDPAGVLIDQSLETELREHLAAHVELDFQRIAITPEQIAEHDLPTKPRKKSDRRSKQILETVEAEAMPAHLLRELLRDEVEALLPLGALERIKVAEESERKGLIELAAALEGGDR